jgi:hypothetical protein
VADPGFLSDGILGTSYLIPVDGYVPCVLSFGSLLINIYIFSVLHPKPLGIKQEITNYAVAASKLSYQQCLIIDVAPYGTSKKTL